jgi:DNA polymerase III epsilon subunit-like protein
MPAGFRVMCVMQRVLWHFHERPAIDPPADFKLGTVCSRLGVQLTDAHDALADCRATVDLYRALVAASVDAL